MWEAAVQIPPTATQDVKSSCHCCNYSGGSLTLTFIKSDKEKSETRDTFMLSPFRITGV